MKLKIFFKKVLCCLKGHSIDWDEYDLRMEREGHHANPRAVLCRKCHQIEVL